MEKLGYYDSAHSLNPTIENLFAHGGVVVSGVVKITRRQHGVRDIPWGSSLAMYERPAGNY